MKTKKFRKTHRVLSLGMVFALLFTVAAYAAEDEKVITGVHFLPAEPVVSVNGQGESSVTWNQPVAYTYGAPETAAAPRASSHPFDWMSLSSTKPSSNTFTMNSVKYQAYSKIEVTGVSNNSSAVFSAEVYRMYNGAWTLVGSYSRIPCNSAGQFSFTHPIGASGDYAIKMWHNLPGTSVKIAGDLIY